MKLLLLFTLMFSAHVYANVCDMSYTFELDSAIESGEIKQVQIKKDAFNANEWSMISETVKVTMESDDVSMFSQGAGAGEIQYLLDEGKMIALVHFWPGDTEVGMIFDVKTKSRIAVIGDSHIDCN